MKKIKIIVGIMFLGLIIGFQSCDDDSDEVYMWIAAETIMGMDEAAGVERPFLQYKFKESDEWRSMYPTIVGFDYEEGYEYLLLVKIETIKKPAMYQHPKMHTLIKLISKTKKETL